MEHLQQGDSIFQFFQTSLDSSEEGYLDILIPCHCYPGAAVS